MKLYSELTLPAELHRALVDLKFTTPTPIQEKAIPIALTGSDLIGCAATGTGKTAAFLIPLLTKLSEKPDAEALILVPTRELALQVTSVHEDLTKYLRGVGAVTVIGGVPMQKQTSILKRKPRVIVATPGRLLDHLKRGSLNLRKISVLVLDEADRMLDMGFQPQLKEILRFLPTERQTLFFSATLPGNILDLSRQYVRNPQQVNVKTAAETSEETKPSANIEEKTVQVEQKEKNDALLDELNARKGSVLVFARTQSRVDRVCRYLESYDISVARIHGGRTQGQRVRAMDGFREGEFRVLVATDLASRGIDVDHVAHVINFDLPQAPEDYIHRIGRTGRAGRSGEAVSFVTREDAPIWRAIERLKSGVASMGPPGSHRPAGSGRSGGGRSAGGGSGGSRGRMSGGGGARTGGRGTADGSSSSRPHSRNAEGARGPRREESGFLGNSRSDDNDFRPNAKPSSARTASPESRDGGPRHSNARPASRGTGPSQQNSSSAPRNSGSGTGRPAGSTRSTSGGPVRADDRYGNREGRSGGPVRADDRYGDGEAPRSAAPQARRDSAPRGGNHPSGDRASQNRGGGRSSDDRSSAAPRGSSSFGRRGSGSPKKSFSFLD